MLAERGPSSGASAAGAYQACASWMLNEGERRELAVQPGARQLSFAGRDEELTEGCTQVICIDLNNGVVERAAASVSLIPFVEFLSKRMTTGVATEVYREHDKQK